MSVRYAGDKLASATEVKLFHVLIVAAAAPMCEVLSWSELRKALNSVNLGVLREKAARWAAELPGKEAEARFVNTIIPRKRSFRLGWFYGRKRSVDGLKRDVRTCAPQDRDVARVSEPAEGVQQASASSSSLVPCPWAVVNRSSRPVHLIDVTDGAPWCGRKSAGGKVRFQSPIAVGDTLDELRAFGPMQREVCERCLRRVPKQTADVVISVCKI